MRCFKLVAGLLAACLDLTCAAIATVPIAALARVGLRRWRSRQRRQRRGCCRRGPPHHHHHPTALHHYQHCHHHVVAIIAVKGITISSVFSLAAGLPGVERGLPQLRHTKDPPDHRLHCPRTPSTRQATTYQIPPTSARLMTKDTKHDHNCKVKPRIY